MTRGKEVFFVLKRTMQSVFRVGSKHSSMKQQKTRSERAYGSNRGTHITKQTKDLHLMPVEKKKTNVPTAGASETQTSDTETLGAKLK